MLQLPPEVLHAICRNTASLDVLAILARTSRQFHQYASTEIWHTLPSFVPIFDTMPEDAYRRERTARPGASPASGMAMPAVTLKAMRPLKPDDLVRFSLYVPLIRRIVPPYSSYWHWRKASIVDIFDCDVSPELWEMLEAIWPRQLLNLEVLEYRQQAYIDRKAYAHPLHIFIGPSLKKLNFTVLYLNSQTGRPDRRTNDTTTQDPNLEIFFERLPHLAPHITTFAFSTEVRVFARDALSQALCGLSQLTSVTLNRTPLRPPAVHYLSTLPALHHLAIKVPLEDELLAEAWPTGATGMFAALRDLVMNAHHFDECIDLLGHVSSSALRSIVVNVQAPSSTGTFQGLASAILAHPSSPASIRSLTLSLYWDEGIPPEAFSPLLPLSALEEFHLGGMVSAAVDDATLCAMARSWPKIKELSLYDWVDDNAPQHPNQATVHGLRYFAQYCPDLESLQVPLSHISASTFALPASMTRPQLDPARPHRLERLGVGRPQLHDETVLAAYLSSLFPALEDSRALLERRCPSGWRRVGGARG
ncbi:hypothetical protein C8T65DRAFT_744715 [Cerioporus squamosus]|nr:hypothetical protein C8T65DRAFT_744715 [Cerioporus squamosus]